MNMRRSKTLELLRAGKVVFSGKCNTADPRVVEIAAMTGLPCIWVDTEHTPNDYCATEKQIMAAKIYDTDILVRVPRGSYSDYIRPLELDASGIMVPHIMSVEDAQNVIRMTRFHPIGRRPVDGGNADTKYCNVPTHEYTRQANEQRFIVLQIEDPEAMEQIEEIAALPGFDMLFFGPGDYSHAIGHPGQLDHPLVQEGFRKVAECARRHGKFAGTVGSMDNAAERVAMGYQFLNLGSDARGLGAYFGAMAEFYRNFGK